MSDEEYEFEYSDNEEEEVQQDDVSIQIENEYYGSKGLKDSDLEGAVSGFKKVLQLASTKGDGSLAEWAFKATKQLVKVSCRKGDYSQMLLFYSQLLEQIKSGVVTRNRAEKSINSILDLVSTARDSSHLPAFYDTTLAALAQGGGNERLAFKTRTKQARLYLAQKDWARLRPLIQSLQAQCLTSSTPSASASATGSGVGVGGAPSSDYATQLLEVYALQVQMATEQRDMRRVSEVLTKAASVRSAVPHPGITGVLREAQGKVCMRERAWEGARIAFMEGFKAYEEAGDSSRTLANLQYMLLANMLSNNRINPFDDQSSKAYERDPAIASMVALTEAYLQGDIGAFEPILRGMAQGQGLGAMDDFMLAYVQDLLTSMRTTVVLTLVQPYDRVRLGWLGAQIGVTQQEAEGIVATLILEGRLHGSIDQPAGVVNLSPAHVKACPPAIPPAGMLAPAKAVGGTTLTFATAEGSGVKDAGAAGIYAELQTLANRLERMIGHISSASSGGTGKGGQLAASLGMGIEGLGGAGKGFMRGLMDEDSAMMGLYE